MVTFSKIMFMSVVSFFQIYGAAASTSCTKGWVCKNGEHRILLSKYEEKYLTERNNNSEKNKQRLVFLSPGNFRGLNCRSAASIEVDTLTGFVVVIADPINNANRNKCTFGGYEFYSKIYLKKDWSVRSVDFASLVSGSPVQDVEGLDISNISHDVDSFEMVKSKLDKLGILGRFYLTSGARGVDSSYEVVFRDPVRIYSSDFPAGTRAEFSDIEYEIVGPKPPWRIRQYLEKPIPFRGAICDDLTTFHVGWIRCQLSSEMKFRKFIIPKSSVLVFHTTLPNPSEDSVGIAYIASLGAKVNFSGKKFQLHDSLIFDGKTFKKDPNPTETESLIRMPMNDN